MSYAFNKFHKDEGFDTSLLDDYAKLAIEITIDDFLSAKTNSTLIPNQWYLITDYRTVAKIGSSTAYHTGEIEQIYVLALSANNVSADAYSKTYPDEKVIFSPIQKDLLDTVNNTGITGSGWSTFDITPISNNELLCDTETMDSLISSSFSAYIYPDLYNNDVWLIELNGNNYNDLWEYNATTNILKINKAPLEAYDEYMSGSSSYGLLEFTPLTSSTVQIKTSTGSDIISVANALITIEDYSTSELITLDSSNYGIDWTFENNVLTLINSSIDLTSYDVSIIFSATIYLPHTDNVFLLSGFYGDFNYEYNSGYTQKGLIIKRQNLRRGLVVDTDYRNRKFRRYKSTSPNWNSSATAGKTYYSNDSIWYCLNNTLSQPAYNDSNWIRLFDSSGYYLSDTAVAGASPDLSQYYDYDLFDLSLFDSNSGIYNSFIGESTADTLDAVFLIGGIPSRSNIYPTKSTFRGVITSSTIVSNNSIFMNAIDASNIYYSSHSFYYGAVKQVLAQTIQYSIFGSSLLAVTINYFALIKAQGSIQNSLFGSKSTTTFTTNINGYSYLTDVIISTTSSILKTDSSGKIVPAVVTDYEIPYYETVAKNLKSYPATFNRTGSVLDSIEYDLGGGLSITKTFNRTGDILNSIVLSGDTPSGISLTKTFNRTGEILTSITYS